MKKILLILVVILLICIVGYLYVSNSVSNNDAYLYKTANYCSNLTKQKMKSPSSFVIDNLSIIMKKSTKEQLEKSIAGDGELNEFYREMNSDGNLSLYYIDVVVDYQARNTFNALLKDHSSCSFYNYTLYDKMSSSPNIISINVGDQNYLSNNMMLNFSELSAGLYDIENISIFDKIQYLLNKDKVSIYYK